MRPALPWIARFALLAITNLGAIAQVLSERTARKVGGVLPMYKSKSASMQRGTAYNDSSDRISREHYNEQTSITLASSEHAHFAFGTTTKKILLERLRPRVRLLAQNRFRKPRDVSRMLNKEGVRTACGEAWTPRLVAFLLAFLFEKSESAPAASGEAVTRLKTRASPKRELSSVRSVRRPKVPLGGPSKREMNDAAKAAARRNQPRKPLINN